jgi:hypothetical protein
MMNDVIQCKTKKQKTIKIIEQESLFFVLFLFIIIIIIIKFIVQT